jgi:MazG family protein
MNVNETGSFSLTLMANKNLFVPLSSFVIARAVARSNRHAIAPSNCMTIASPSARNDSRAEEKIVDLKQTERLLKVVHELRQKCPWDRKQTHKTLIPYLIEEAYETVDAIEERTDDGLREELGDLLLQIVLHSEISREKGKFSFEEVAKGITDKMVRRHPHIYGDVEFKDMKTHLQRWNKLKEQEKKEKGKGQSDGLLARTPKSLPALGLAQKYCDLSTSVGFDWPHIDNVFEKIQEEIGELRRELRRKRKRSADIEMEFGDLLFTLTRVASHLKIDSERALRRSALKFLDRFSAMESYFGDRGKKLSDLGLDEMEKVWNQQKKKKKLVSQRYRA